MAGRIDVTAGIVGAIDLNAMARGGGFRIVADKGHEEGGGCSFGGFVVPPGAGRPEPPGKFRVPRFSIYEFLLDRAMEAEGKDPASIDRVDVPVAVVPRGLATGALSGAAMDEPGLSRSLDAGDASLWKRYPEVFPGFQFAYVTFGRALLGPRRAEGVRFLRAYLRGVARYREGKTARNLAVIARRTGIPEKELARACWPAISANGSFDPATLDRYQEWCLSRRLIPRKLSLTEVADTDLARQAAAGLAAPR
jgi:ABC-type nitrate/sulfonate/bicarbonate transport system substrate-binding protein